MATITGATIVSITEGTKFDPRGTVVRTKIVRYMVGTDGPFTLEVEPQNDSVDYMAAEINKQVARVAALRGNQ
jgi:hypothetical protein